MDVEFIIVTSRGTDLDLEIDPDGYKGTEKRANVW